MVNANGRSDLGWSHCCGRGWLVAIGAGSQVGAQQGALTGAAVEGVNAWQVPQVPGGRISAMAGVWWVRRSQEFRQQTANEQIAAGGFIAGEGGTWLWVTGWECLGRVRVQAG